MVGHELGRWNALTISRRRTLSDSEKANYITAVQCLQSHLPQDSRLTGAKSRFDEFQALHLQMADSVHTVVRKVRIYGIPHTAHGLILGPVPSVAQTLRENV